MADGVLFDNGYSVGIGTTTPTGDLHVKSTLFSASVIDQQQPVYENIIGGSSVNWQSFTAGITGFLTRIDLKVSSPLAGPSPGTIKIFSGEGNNGVLLSSTDVTFQPGSFGSPFQSFLLSSFPPLIAGNIYTFEFSVPTLIYAWVFDRGGNLYTGGRANTSTNLDYVLKLTLKLVQVPLTH